MAGHSKDVAVVEESSMAKVAAREVSRLARMATPWVVGVFGYGLAAALHFVLYDPGTIAAWSSIATICVVVLTGVTYGQSHARGPWGKTHTTATTFLVGMWTVATIIAGPGHPAIWRIGVLGGFTTALTWNIRTVIRAKGWDEQGAITDPLSFLFDRNKRQAGLGGATIHTVEEGESKIAARLQLPPGEKTAEDAQKRAANMESGMQLPPGTVTVTVNRDDASVADVVLSDPRVMENPIYWPGPSLPGGTAADPVRNGVWQDLEPVSYVITGHHLQIMGMTGSGKSFGGCWSLLGELITRDGSEHAEQTGESADAVVVFAIDITKGEQTLGPLRPALHRLETTEEGAKRLINDLEAILKKRTDDLSARGYLKWAPGCGLSYIVLWIEEAADVFEVIDMDKFNRLMKALRSGGGGVVYSLQRADSSQLPTLTKGQAGNMCFGVANSHDAGWGLSEAQQDAGASPELWENRQPGMAYLGAPTIPRARIAMPLRAYDWGRTDAERNRTMRQHAEAWPASARVPDPITATICAPSTGPAGGPDGAEAEEDVSGVVEEYLESDDPDPEVQGDIDDEIPDLPEGDPPWTFAGPARRMSAEERGQALLGRLQELWDGGARDFSTGDFKPLWESTDMSRSWVQKTLKKLVAAGVLAGYDEDRQRYLMPDRPKVD
ncbi:hypothetical protein Ssi03_45940 [Sphaerisporangium siamense]|uniref:Sporulation protein SsgA n=1 Tax=Sphaerisporangium siamense TaxID=795645 RepID=A0A7W7D364_9ACTN|nr:hypothetical protein [Sphaerisporangium siamense]MBB4699271.1 hypothetical protein [Sphaerisporangium siamense]GII86604.1 hypothetical protein Ssi03_45940 [Sphaerisporangium siamense]